MGKRILGIDTGTNSLGWAVVEKNEDGTYELLRKGSLIFQEGVKIEKGNESSKASDRTMHRASRKHYFRRRLRKIKALKVLMKYGMCPQVSDEALHEWHIKKKYPMSEALMAWQRTDESLDRNPYAYRHICLHDELDLDNEAERFILGRAMYHLAQRRGFVSNRLEQNEEEDNETGKVRKDISDLTQEMEKAGCEYLGDYFYSLYKRGKRIRNRYTDREEHYRKEFHAICHKQHLTPEQVTDLEKALYFQRPLKSQRQGVGRCTFEKRKPRCADSHPDYELFRMLSFLNNIKVQGPYDTCLRPLNEEERQKAEKKFYRKSNKQLYFEDIAKAIAGRNNYQHIKDEGDKPYKFNYRMTQSVTGCPTISSLKAIFGEDYRHGIAEVYTLSAGKTQGMMVDDVWNVLYSFPDRENLRQWAKDKLQLDDDVAERFSKIRLTHSFASISLSAIRRILPWLERGLIYSHAVLMAKVPDIVGEEIWRQKYAVITDELMNLIGNFNPKDSSLQGTLEFCIKDYLVNNFNLPAGAADKLYHPSMIETYEDAKKNGQGIYQLGSPRTNAVRNPMAMRSLHQLRKVVNALLRDGIVTPDTEVHVEYARELNDANKRKAIALWNKKREDERKKFAEEIRKLYREECGTNIEPTEEDIQKFQLWEEQGRVCLYTGKQIGISDFLGANPEYDIEHTIPRSVGGDSTMENLTLCSNRFNRDVKKAMIPTELANHDEIMARISGWKDKIEKLRREADKKRTHSGMAKEQKDTQIQQRHLLQLELEYWQGKYRRFTMKEVPEGFSRRQGAGIGLVGKYAGLYLKSLFHKKDDRTRTNVRVVKGATTAEYRKMWGIQGEYEKKSRDNHIHHCIDAITIACIDQGDYNATARYYRQLEEYERTKAARPVFPKPWPTFTEDINALAEETLVVHDTPDNLPKRWKKNVMTPNGKRVTGGDSVRGALHNDTYYGAIERDGEIRYVVRKALSLFKKASEAESIVDDAVREIVMDAFKEKGFKEAIAEGIYMNKEKGIRINKVRCYANSVRNPLHIRQHRDVSRKEYKRMFHVQNEGNYILAIYEGVVKGKCKRGFELVKTIEAANFFKQSTDRDDFPALIPETSKEGYPLKYRLKIGQHVILYENSPQEIDLNDNADVCRRLYYITGLSYLPVSNGYGTIVIRHHQEARMAKDIKAKNGAYKTNEEHRSAIIMLHTQFNALVEGRDFIITPLGEIKLTHEI
ncbi:MAG: HNH endonuclease domain-containing protein [Prevotellaceae bacterium]|nr:HNH endonuclease domain-containing protein [Prevotellaceae bacterium]